MNDRDYIVGDQPAHPPTDETPDLRPDELAVLQRIVDELEQLDYATSNRLANYLADRYRNTLPF